MTTPSYGRRSNLLNSAHVSSTIFTQLFTFACHSGMSQRWKRLIKRQGTMLPSIFLFRPTQNCRTRLRANRKMHISIQHFFPSKMSKKPTQKLAPIQNLPTTLLLNVAKYLPTHSVVALSLTCKTLYADEVLYGTWKTALRKDQRYDASYNGSNSLGSSIKSLQTRSLTRLLERDMPSHFSCDVCSRLHPQRDLLKFMTRADCDSWGPCTRYPTQGNWLHYDTWDLHLNFEHLCQTFSRHVRDTGSAAAFIASNAFSSGWSPGRYSGLPWKEKLDLRPMVHDETLIMHTCQRILFNKRDIRPATNIRPATSCLQPRTISSVLKPCQCPCGTNAADLLNKVTSMLHGASRKVGSISTRLEFEKCKTCLTQYSANIHEHEENLVICLDAWTTVGSLRRYHGFDTKPANVLTIRYPGDYLTLETMPRFSDYPAVHHTFPTTVYFIGNKPQVTGVWTGLSCIPRVSLGLGPTAEPIATFGPTVEPIITFEPIVESMVAFGSKFTATFRTKSNATFNAHIKATTKLLEPASVPRFEPTVRRPAESEDESEDGLGYGIRSEHTIEHTIEPIALPPSYQSLFPTKPVRQTASEGAKPQIGIVPPAENVTAPPTPDVNIPAQTLGRGNEGRLGRMIEALRGMFTRVAGRKGRLS